MPVSATRKQKSKRYQTHHNRGRPFYVTIKGKSVSVEKNMDTFKQVDGRFVDVKKEPKALFTVKAEEIYIGKASPNGGYDGLKPSQAEGNSILLKVGSKYMFIGHEIYEFTPVKGDTIVKYYSDIGNNDVPYPYAIGKTHIYIMLDRVAVDKSYFDMEDEIYDQYYLPQRNKDTGLGKIKEEELEEDTVKIRTKILYK